MIFFLDALLPPEPRNFLLCHTLWNSLPDPEPWNWWRRRRWNCLSSFCSINSTVLYLLHVIMFINSLISLVKFVVQAMRDHKNDDRNKTHEVHDEVPTSIIYQPRATDPT
ncbi:hypothetical protein PanWU01x14_107220 [Parasponia andersonii]|uniref:Uncharacterized protein n=1 Tax=Parasponia andersonii TaxID=3476 RepID=A0A2P5D0D1_PARAD|nr:hypothetical protein PanWU01x14_107220 [Parasponia andersonii]